MIEKSKALCKLTLTIVSCTQPSRNRLIGSLPTMTPAASKGKKRAIPIPQLMARYIFSLSPIKIKKENISIFRLCLFEKPPFGKTSLLHILCDSQHQQPIGLVMPAGGRSSTLGKILAKRGKN